MVLKNSEGNGTVLDDLKIEEPGLRRDSNKKVSVMDHSVDQNINPTSENPLISSRRSHIKKKEKPKNQIKDD